jgi:hypothetical protein
MVMRYYSTQRPVMPGSYPKNGVVEIHNFDDKTYCDEIGREAWGYIDYEGKLPETDAKAYELVEAGKKTWYCVTSSFDDKGRVTAAITATKEATQQPESGYKSTSRKDIYTDWYESREAAQEAVEEAKRA